MQERTKPHRITSLNPALLAFWCMQSGFGGGTYSDRHTTDMGGGMQSILERNDLDELMAMVRISDSSSD